MMKIQKLLLPVVLGLSLFSGSLQAITLFSDDFQTNSVVSGNGTNWSPANVNFVGADYANTTPNVGPAGTGDTALWFNSSGGEQRAAVRTKTTITSGFTPTQLKLNINYKVPAPGDLFQMGLANNSALTNGINLYLGPLGAGSGFLNIDRVTDASTWSPYGGPTTTNLATISYNDVAYFSQFNWSNLELVVDIGATSTTYTANWTGVTGWGGGTVTTSFVDNTANRLQGTEWHIFAGQYRSTGSNLAYMDNVLLTAVPEPSTFAMLGLGVAGIAFLRRRRR